MEEPFSYLPLPLRGWFRLLTIDPSKDEASAISCKLQHYDVSECPQYEAISYTWGNENATERMLVNDGFFALRPNLHAALKALRRPDTPRIIWVDAICINQQDEAERNHQVLQMNKIYSLAQVVDVWLGSATESSDAGVAFLEYFYSTVYHDSDQLVTGSATDVSESTGFAGKDRRATSIYPESTKSYHDFYAPVLSLLDDPKVAADLNHAVALLGNNWWRRIWTLQESVLCPNVLCWCGSKTFPFEYLLYLSYFLYFLVNHNVWPGAQIHSGMTLSVVRRVEDLRKQMVSHKRIGLALALYSTWNRAATDPRDKVIGLLGLVERRHDLKPEYSWPVEKVYRVAMRAALVEEGNLDSLGLISEGKELRNKNLSSWVPDFALHSGSTPNADHITSLSKRFMNPPIYNASLHGSDNKPMIRTEKDDTILVLKGLHIDVVQTVGPRAPGPYFPDTSEESFANWRNVMRETLNQWRTLLPVGDVYLTRESQNLAFWRTVHADLKQGQHPTPAKAIGPKRLDENDLQQLPQLDTSEKIESLLDTWQACLRPIYRQLRLIEQFNRRFFVTESGYIGLGPPDLEPRDSICVLLGGRVAYALRKGSDGTWSYIGECYVHGIMDGEAVAKGIEDKDMFANFYIY
ncbi:hypothetical protein FSARC_9326 [Fusarium sarcochroum]|uniref:Heterokaryon incompatibility domain-containing protein n=1 Tax=Fusarium sarcochroum TaxID=1208366 RepID=A0A8H4TR05_9HYPO|nr:hypothetical protein FSARC_9326 [Fusarium sarcochroum]